MRAIAGSALLLLAACGGDPGDAPPAEGAAAEDDSTIACALEGEAEFVRACSVERVRGEGGLELVVRHPDGAFRRFAVLTDGRGLAVADGAQAAQVAVREGGVEVAVGADRYRFPATVSPHDGR